MRETKWHNAGGYKQMERFGYTNLTAGQPIGNLTKFSDVNTNNINNADGDKDSVINLYYPNKRKNMAVAVALISGLAVAHLRGKTGTMDYVKYSVGFGITTYILYSLLNK